LDPIDATCRWRPLIEQRKPTLIDLWRNASDGRLRERATSVPLLTQIEKTAIRLGIYERWGWQRGNCYPELPVTITTHTHASKN
jgi:hypothetical protein